MGYGCLLSNSHGIIDCGKPRQHTGYSKFNSSASLGNPRGTKLAPNVILESDAKILIDTLNLSVFHSFRQSLIVEDCKFFALRFHSCLFVFVKRSVNQVVQAALIRACDSIYV